MSQHLDNMTLQHKLTEAERLCRELIHHLEHGFIPKAHGLLRMARQGSDHSGFNDASDRTVRNAVDTVLESDDFSRQLTTQLSEYLVAIDHDVKRNTG
ncbi:hypothetical protein [Planctomicrobium sp. SH664]|uniref:hypothetical protein n=1 Tax=Planctomicrobium sp. SH664 TaxID=3448125 RepID=UPI003F5C3237